MPDLANVPQPMPTLPPFVARSAVAVTPSDTTVLNFAALYVAVSGNITIMPLGSSTPVLFSNVPVGFFPVAGQKVMQTGTSGGLGIVALN